MLKKLAKLNSKDGRNRARFYLSRNILNPILRPLGFTLIADHFYQPIPNDDEIALYLQIERPLPAIEKRLLEQISFCKKFF